jgi:Tol biopolymer transport system component
VQSDRNRHQLGLVSSAGVVNNVNLHLAAGAPAWSPDGAQIAFFGESGISELGELYRSGNGIWLVNPVNYSVRSLLSMDHVKNINWSPDGRKLAFEFGPPNEAHQVLIIDPVDGRELGRFSGEQPAWNPDSNLLVIKSCAPECGLWQIGLDGSGGRLLTDGSTDSYPTWSPDGRYLAFTSRNRTGDWEIYRMTIPGGTLQQLTNRSGTDVSPIFSPDSLEIYFRSDAFGTWQLRAMSINGQNERLILSDIGVSDDWGLARPAIH